MSRHPAYTGEHPRCIKCGNLGAYTCFEEGMTGECLERKCTRCGYGWRESTVQQRPPVHTGGNAEDCPACSSTNPPYPFICPGPSALDGP